VLVIGYGAPPVAAPSLPIDQVVITGSFNSLGGAGSFAGQFPRLL
jgi:hypothetical protein